MNQWIHRTRNVLNKLRIEPPLLHDLTSFEQFGFDHQMQREESALERARQRRKSEDLP